MNVVYCTASLPVCVISTKVCYVSVCEHKLEVLEPNHTGRPYDGTFHCSLLSGAGLTSGFNGLQLGVKTL